MAERETAASPDARAIVGVIVRPLRVIPDERGRLMEILRRDDSFFTGFGQVYLSTIVPGAVKAWHYHLIQEERFTCVKGMVKAVLFDDRGDSPTRGCVNEFFVGDYNPSLIVIPPGVCHGMKCISGDEAYVIIIPSEPYDSGNPDKFRVHPREGGIPYDWSRKDG